MLAAALALTFFVWRRRAIERAPGVAMVVAYGAYLVALLGYT